MRLRELGSIVAAGAVVFLIAILRSGEQSAPSIPSSYDNGSFGYSALYEFLAREGIRVARFERPVEDLGPRTTLLLAGDFALDRALPNASAQKALAHWVHDGGRLVVLGRNFNDMRKTLALPRLHLLLAGPSVAATSPCGYAGPALTIAGEFDGTFDASCGQTQAAFLRSVRGAAGAVRRSGKGEIIAAVTSTLFDNAHIAQAENARLAYDVFGGSRVVQFDERVNGYAQGASFWQAVPLPAKLGFLLTAIALLLGIIGGNIRSAPVLELPSLDERDTSAYIASLALMLRRGGAARAMIERLWEAARALGRGRFEYAGAGAVSSELSLLQERLRPSPHDVLRAGVLYAWMRKNYE